MSAIWKTSAVATGLEKVNFHSNSKKGQCQKCSKYYTVVLISHTSKFMLKIPQARLQQFMNFQRHKLSFEETEELEITLVT